MHKYAARVMVADARDGARSSSTLKEASSWGKVDTTYEQMVFAKATSVLPLITRYVYHKRLWQDRPQRRWSRIYGPALAGERE
jgi:deoxyhypusine synthase